MDNTVHNCVVCGWSLMFHPTDEICDGSEEALSQITDNIKKAIGQDFFRFCARWGILPKRGKVQFVTDGADMLISISLIKQDNTVLLASNIEKL